MARGFEIVNSGDRYKINTPSVIGQTFDDEAVIVNLETGSYYSMDKIAAEIWDAIQTGTSCGSIAAGLVRRYQGTPAEIENTVDDLIRRLLAEELIRPALDETPDGVCSTPIMTAHEESKFMRPLQPAALHKYTDMQELLLLDPIHEVDESGWPHHQVPQDHSDSNNDKGKKDPGAMG